MNLHLYLHGLSGSYDFQGEWIFVVKPVNGKYNRQDTQGLQIFEVDPKGVAVQRSKTEERLNSLIRARKVGKVEMILKHPDANTLYSGGTIIFSEPKNKVSKRTLNNYWIVNFCLDISINFAHLLQFSSLVLFVFSNSLHTSK